MIDITTVFREYYPPVVLKNNEILEVIEEFTDALSAIMAIQQGLNGPTFNFLALSEDCRAAWEALNRARVFTETVLFIEEIVIPVMGAINDAKCMLGSLVAWKLGMTSPGLRSILGCIDSSESHIRMCLDEIVSWMNPSEGKSDADFLGLLDEYAS